MSFWVITVVFNCQKYKSRYILYERFRRYVVEELKTNLLTVELVYNDDKFVVTNRPKHDNEIFVQLRTKDVLWHKENLLNIGLKHLPDDCEYVASIDADVQFERVDIVEATIEALQKYTVVQMFGSYVSWGPGGKSIEKEDESTGKKFVDSTMFKSPGLWFIGHPGYAHCFRRSLICSLSFPCFPILGSGDTIMMLCFVSKCCYLINERVGGKKLPEPYLLAILNYETKAEKIFERKLGYVEGKIYHSFHGILANRKYVDRKNVLIDGKYDPDKDIQYNKDGIIEWTESAKSSKVNMIEQVKEYFKGRLEDDLPCFSANGATKSKLHHFNENTFVYSELHSQ
jgi:hypothetical protein